MKKSRRHFEVHYEGHVQGVGFRYTTRSVAGRFEVTGFVENLPDGRVRLVAQGVESELTGFLDRVDQELGPFIRNQHRRELPLTQEFDDFSIRY